MQNLDNNSSKLLNIANLSTTGPMSLLEFACTERLVPIDIFKVAKAVGIKILIEDRGFDQPHSRLVVQSKTDVVMWVNPRTGHFRRRYSIAFQIAHFIQHALPKIINDEVCDDFEDCQSLIKFTMGLDPQIFAANLYAIGLLMPEKACCKYRDKSFFELPRTFGVPHSLIARKFHVIADKDSIYCALDTN